MQCADDTLLFLQCDLPRAQNLKWLLSLFEQLSGMKINFHKSDLYFVGMDDNARSFAQSLGCKLGEWSMKFLGVPLHHSKLRNEDLQPVINKVIKRVAGWRGKLLCHGRNLLY